jgi:hypothetical protein
MRNGHNLEIYVMPLLKSLGYKKKDIRNVQDTSLIGTKTFTYPIPDYIISHTIAVEVGGLSKKTKIQDLLLDYEKVIWIFADHNLPFLNCIIYTRGEIKNKVDLEKLKEEYKDRINDVEKENENLKKEIKELEQRRKNLRTKLTAINGIVESKGCENGKWDIAVKFRAEDYPKMNDFDFTT